jgi:adenylate cyclase
MERKLTAILAADVVGYSRLMEADEAGTLSALKSHRKELIDPEIAERNGRVVKLMGDGALIEFASVVDAVICAVAIQEGIANRNESVPEERRIVFRIGVHLGDVMVEGDDIYGDGVNVAARLEGLAEPGGICISQQAFDQVETKLDLTYEDLGEQQVKNIARPVRAYHVHSDPAAMPKLSRAKRNLWRRATLAVATVAVLVIAGLTSWELYLRPSGILGELVSGEDAALALPQGPAIAVLPFVNLSNDPDQEYFADGITGDIIIELTRFPKLFVIGRNTSFQFKGQNVDVREIGRKLGVRYVVEGSVRKVDKDIRVTAQLLDATTGAHLWAETYERELTAENIFAVQDDIKNRIVSIIAGDFGVISRARMKDVAAKKTDSLDAYECVLIANAYDNLYTPEAHLRARTCMERAVELDPNYSDAWAWLGFLYADEYRYGFNPRPDSLDRALKASLHAVDVDPRSYWAHENLAHTYFTLRDVEQFFAEADRALALNSNSSTGLAGLGVRMVNAGAVDRGIKLMEKAIALNPDYPTWYHFPIFVYYYRQGSYEKALTEAQGMNLPGLLVTHLNLAAAYGQLGRGKEARAAIAKVLELDPNYPEKTRSEFDKWNNPDDYIKKMMEGLRKAGLTEKGS